MTEVLHANIFFFISSAGIIVLTVLVCVVIYQVIKILQAVRRIVERVDAGSEMIAEDVEQFRSYVMQGSLVSQIIGFFMSKAPRRRASRTRVDVTDED